MNSWQHMLQRTWDLLASALLLVSRVFKYGGQFATEDLDGGIFPCTLQDKLYEFLSGGSGDGGHWPRRPGSKEEFGIVELHTHLINCCTRPLST